MSQEPQIHLYRPHLGSNQAVSELTLRMPRRWSRAARGFRPENPPAQGERTRHPRQRDVVRPRKRWGAWWSITKGASPMLQKGSCKVTQWNSCDILAHLQLDKTRSSHEPIKSAGTTWARQCKSGSIIPCGLDKMAALPKNCLMKPLTYFKAVQGHPLPTGLFRLAHWHSSSRSRPSGRPRSVLGRQNFAGDPRSVSRKRGWNVRPSLSASFI